MTASGPSLTDPARMLVLDRQRRLSVEALVFEVAGESLKDDRLTKSALYASAGIPEYVIVNVDEECLEVHRDPDSPSRRYRTLATLPGDQAFESSSVPGFAFRVASRFG